MEIKIQSCCDLEHNGGRCCVNEEDIHNIKYWVQLLHKRAAVYRYCDDMYIQRALCCYLLGACHIFLCIAQCVLYCVMP